MKLLLLMALALAGPFCSSTRASPTGLPEDVIFTTAAVAPPDEPVITGPPPTHPPAAPEVVETLPATTAPIPTVQFEPETTAAPAAEEPTILDAEVTTPAAAKESETPTDALTEAATTESKGPHVEPTVPRPTPTTGGQADPEPEVVERVEEEEEAEVTLEDDEGGLSSGHIIGIVIGAILAVVIAVAIVIAVVRRMGKYSSATSRKPAKKDSVVVSPLRKKPTKQQERAKFWKS